MKTYKYKALDMKGNIIRGKLNAIDDNQLIYLTRKKQLFLLKYKSTTEMKCVNKVSYKDVSTFCNQLSEILRCGISLIQGIDMICSQKINPLIKESLYVLKEDIENGKSIFTSMKKFPKVYPRFMIEMIQIGEEGGILVKVLDNLSKYYIEQYNIQKKIKTALTYPVVVCVTTIIMIIFLLLKVVPNLINDLSQFGNINLERLDKIIKFNELITSKVVLLFSLFIFVLMIILYKKGYLGKVFDFVKFKFPIVNSIYTDMYEISIAKSLTILIGSGIPIISALEMIKSSLNKGHIEEKVAKVIYNIKEGMNLSKALEKEKLFKDFFTTMITIGEETGNLENMIENAATIQEFDINETLNKISKLIEPTIILILAAIITIIIINVLLPIMSIVDSIDLTY